MKVFLFNYLISNLIANRHKIYSIKNLEKSIKKIGTIISRVSTLF
jgi:hypothetical protein